MISRILAAGFLISGLTASFAFAQEGCQATSQSCSQLNAACESRCQNGNNPGRCIAAGCSVTLSKCQASGVWKGRAAACWKTNNRG